MAYLQQGLKKDMVLVVMSNQHVVDLVGEIQVGVAGYVALVGIAQYRVKHHADPSGFDQDAGMAEISPPHPGPIIGHIFRRRRLGQEGTKQGTLSSISVDSDHIGDFAKW